MVSRDNQYSSSTQVTPEVPHTPLSCAKLFQISSYSCGLCWVQSWSLGMSSGSIFEWLQTQPSAVVEKLYGRTSGLNGNGSKQGESQAPFVCKAVFQSLSALAKNYLMRLLFVEKPVTCKELGDWIGGGYRRPEHLAAMEELIKLNILEEVLDGGSTGTGNVDTDMDVEVINEGNQVFAMIDGNFERVTVAQYSMNDHFRRNFKQALASPEEPWALQKALSHASFMEAAEVLPSNGDLEKASFQKWDALLRFLVKIEGASAVAPGSTIDTFVCRTGLMANRGVAQNKAYDATKRTRGQVQNLHITAKGYEYMLKSYQQQVWLFVFENIQHHEEDRDEVLSLLFMLSYCEFGQGYPLQALTKVQQEIVSEFAEVGLVYVHSTSAVSLDSGGSADTQFYPSSIAINMMFKSFGPSGQSLHSQIKVGYEDKKPLGAAEGDTTHNLGMQVTTGLSSSGVQGSRPMLVPGTMGSSAPALTSGLEIIVETNMQVVAYLTSPLHLALLGLFVEFAVQMPNVAIGRISRDKAKEAFDLGIRVDQIIEFLCVHAHSLVKNEQPVIPTNVVDQLVLWESEKFRIKDTESILVDFTKLGANSGFGAASAGLTKEQFQEVDMQAKRIKACLFSDTKEMVMVLTYDGYDQIVAFIEDKFGIV